MPPLLQADVVVLKNGQVVTGNVLQQDDQGVLVQTENGTFRYPPTLIKEVKQEANTVHHLTKAGQPIPDWSQIVVLLAKNGWATEIQQVPATVINYGKYNHVPYVAFRCATGGYELNIFGDLDDPAAVQIGAMTYLKDNPAARSNCVNFICSVLPNAKVREAVRALNLTQKQLSTIGNMTLETLLPGEWGSYGGWWMSVYDTNSLAKAAASDADMLALAQMSAATAPPGTATAPAAAPTAEAGQPDAASQPTTTQPTTTTTTTTYGYPYGYGWTAAELAAARPGTPATYPANTAANQPQNTAAKQTANSGAKQTANSSGNVYPRSYNRSGGSYGRRR